MQNEMVWRTIDSAPKDGTWVMLTGGEVDYGWDGDTKPEIVVGFYKGTGTYDNWFFAVYDSGYYGQYENPKLWMPLPRTPTALLP
jgi:hypothetical protein